MAHRMTTRYTAIIVEPRKHKALEFVLQNALDSLPDDWSIVLFHGLMNKEYCDSILVRLSRPERIQLVQLQVDNLNQKTYSELFATRSILYDYIQTEWFLVFQTDSMMFPQHLNTFKRLLDKRYDYIGSPWLQTNYPPTRIRGYVGNGGFSLRRTEKMLEIIDKHDWHAVKHTEFEWLEDLYFTKPYTDVSVNKAPYDEARCFSVDEVFYPNPFACHKPWVHSHYAEFVKLYPDVQQLNDLQSNDD